MSSDHYSLAAGGEGVEPAGERPSVLILDDRQENIDVVAAVLDGLGLNLLTANSGLEAIEMFQNHKLAAAVLDVCMPGVDGFEVARRVHSQGNRVPIIFITALSREEQFMRLAYSIGCVDFLYKPVEPIALRAKVKVFVDLFRLYQSQESKARELNALNESLAQQWVKTEKMASELTTQKAELECRNRELSLRNRQLDNFTHVISHDLRQPLGSILNYLELMDDSSDCLDDNAVGWIRSCLRLGHSMQELIENVLELSRLGGQVSVMLLTDTRAALGNALDNLHAAVDQSGALISTDELPMVQGSEKLLTCLFQNLISNAIKYRGPEPLRIQIGCAWRDDEQKWCFRIADNGRGFTRDDHERIFQMFHRCAGMDKTPGTGIGLAICKTIVEAHGGRIWAESEPGGGAEFFFLLPAALQVGEALEVTQCI